MWIGCWSCLGEVGAWVLQAWGVALHSAAVCEAEPGSLLLCVPGMENSHCHPIVAAAMACPDAT